MGRPAPSFESCCLCGVLVVGVMGLLLLFGAATASALDPSVTVLTSPTHPSETAWYSSRSVSFHWEGSPVTHSVGYPADYGAVSGGMLWDMQAVGDLLYTVGSGGTAYGKVEPVVSVFDLAAAGGPQLVGSWAGYPAYPENSLYGENIAVQGDYAYVGVEDHTFGSEDAWFLVVLDVSDPTSPTFVGSGPSYGEFTEWGGIVAQGSYVYVTRSFNDAYDANDEDRAYLDVVDVSNPAQPTVVGSCLLPGLAPWGMCAYRRIAAKDGFLYVTVESGSGFNPWLCQIDVRNPLAPNPTAILDYPCGNASIDGDVLFACGPVANLTWPNSANADLALGGLEVFDVSDPLSVQWLGAMKGEEDEWPGVTTYRALSLAPTDPTLSKHYIFNSARWSSWDTMVDLHNEYVATYDVTQPLPSLHPAPPYMSMVDTVSEFSEHEPDLLAFANDRLVWGYSGGYFFIEHVGPVAYSYVFDQSPGTTPGTTPADTQSGLGADISITAPSDGTFYLHVRAQDAAGNWSPTVTRKVQIGSGGTKPQITGLIPTSGLAGTPVTIIGTDFGSAGTVKFGTTPANTQSWTATQIGCTVPASLTPATYAVTVSNANGTSNAMNFTVTGSVPTITSLSPTSGAASSPVTIIGSNFGASGTVKFNTTTAATQTWTDTVIVATVPASLTPATYAVTVTTGAGTSNGVNFLVTVTGSAPVTTISHADDLSLWHNHDVAVSFTVTDADGDLEDLYLKVDDRDWEAWEYPTYTGIIFRKLDDYAHDGDHTVLYQGRDLAGHVETPRSFTVKLDTRRPVAKALYAVTVRKGRAATLKYRVNDLAPNGGTATGVKIVVKNRSGRTVKTFRLGTRQVNKTYSARFTCKLAKGSYRWYVSGKDTAGNAAKVGSNRLTVR